ncbi:MAG: Asp-tRNA(Asn)/Glu-tRNA(Gln) amidotransferase subunit GatB [Bacteroidota bacterium]
MEENIYESYETVVGLEVHAQLLTESKAYNTDSTEYGQLPNTNISVITLAHPGTLPKLNSRVVDYAIKMGLALDCEITQHNIFDRKNYFYPDLPKGYQITQDKTPICRNGKITVKTASGDEKFVGITRIHMEEDAGKSLHLEGSEESLIDLNRAGVPLIEIVTEPDIRTPEQAQAYLQEIRRLVRYLGICDGNMEEGSMRCDANISVRKKGDTKFGQRVEVKNMNSTRNVMRAIEFEAKRQIDLIESGGTVEGETRNFDAPTGITTPLRMKETMNDYRYFPEPDLQPLEVTESYIASIRAQMPSLPAELRAKFMEEYGLPEYDANVIVDDKATALYFEELCTKTKHYKAASNWIMGPIKSYLNDLTLPMEDFSLSPARLAGIIALVEANKISFAVASQQLFPEILKNEKSADELAKELDLLHDSSEDTISPIVEGIIAEFPDKVAAYRAGKKGLLGMFMGQLMRRTKGKVDPKVASKLLEEMLEG